MYNLENLSIKELLTLAKTTDSEKLLLELSKSFFTDVRRCVARNKNTTSQILNNLIFDPSLNVAYMASQNKNCSKKRDFYDLSNPCIICNKDEINTYCGSCPDLNKFYK